MPPLASTSLFSKLGDGTLTVWVQPPRATKSHVNTAIGATGGSVGQGLFGWINARQRTIS